MPPEDRDLAFLWDMHDAAQKVGAFIAGIALEHFKHDDLLQAAVERKIEIIGEAARRVSQTFRDAHPQIPWAPIMATRHILAHEYGDVDPDVVWRIATVHVPALVALLHTLVPQPPPDPQQ